MDESLDVSLEAGGLTLRLPVRADSGADLRGQILMASGREAPEGRRWQSAGQSCMVPHSRFESRARVPDFTAKLLALRPSLWFSESL